MGVKKKPIQQTVKKQPAKRPAPTKQMRSQPIVHTRYLSNGQPRPKKRG
jgi:hypothetical protein